MAAPNMCLMQGRKIFRPCYLRKRSDAAVPRHGFGFGKRMLTPPCAAVCFASELPARICCDAGIVPIFFNFFPAETRLNRPDLNLNQDGSHLNCPDSH
ncbi:hypothetical protein [Candidatus Electronema sp. TJ]|uniref:hypothetical protein n=1 Tax=Candidatus Electronema sp. TJ TaxID=3401573 RepID=UPI003AA86AD6